MKKFQRTQLHTSDIMKWLQKTHPKSSTESYKFFPEELLKRQELNLLFNKFDKDGSDALDFEEVFQMFNKFGFFITKEELLDYFKIVDQNKDLSLNKEEFQSCILDEEAKKCFTNIMKKLIERNKESKIIFDPQRLVDLNDDPNQVQPSPIIPLSFDKVINLITYMSMREELKVQLLQKPVIIQQKLPILRQISELTKVIEVGSVIVLNNHKTNQNLQNKGDYESHRKRIQSSKLARLFEKEINTIRIKAQDQAFKNAHNELKTRNSSHEIPNAQKIVMGYEYQQSSFPEFKFQKIVPNHPNPQKFLSHRSISIRQRSKFRQHSENQIPNLPTKFKTYINSPQAKVSDFFIPDNLKYLDTQIWSKVFEEKTNMEFKTLNNQLNKVRSENSFQKFNQVRKQYQEQIDIKINGLKELNVDCSSLKYKDFAKSNHKGFNLEDLTSFIGKPLSTNKNSQYGLQSIVENDNTTEVNIQDKNSLNNKTSSNITCNMKRELRQGREANQWFNNKFLKSSPNSTYSTQLSKTQQRNFKSVFIDY